MYIRSGESSTPSFFWMDVAAAYVTPDIDRKADAERVARRVLALDRHATREEEQLLALLRTRSERARHLVEMMEIVHDEVRGLFEEIQSDSDPKNKLWTILEMTEAHFERLAAVATRAIPLMSGEYAKRMEPLVRKLSGLGKAQFKDNPFGVPISKGTWGGNGFVVSFAKVLNEVPVKNTTPFSLIMARMGAPVVPALPSTALSASTCASSMSSGTPRKVVHPTRTNRLRLKTNPAFMVINSNAELVGLIFDGNIQSLVGDFIYDETQNRAVAVDSRAMLEALRKIYGADALARELVGGVSATARPSASPPVRQR